MKNLVMRDKSSYIDNFVEKVQIVIKIIDMKIVFLILEKYVVIMILNKIYQ